jgi:DNA-binding GntR family transcriptional regulator
VDDQDVVLEILRDMILNRQLSPNKRLSARGLLPIILPTVAKLLGHDVTDAPVRWALNVLETEGLVRRVRGRGTWIIIPPSDDIRQITLLRCAIESLVMRELVKQEQGPNLEEVDNLIGVMDDAVQKKDQTLYLNKDTELHCLLAKLARLPMAADILKGLRNKFQMYSFEILEEDMMIPSQEEHRKIIDGITRRDEHNVVTCVIEHLVNSADRLGVVVDYKY